MVEFYYLSRPAFSHSRFDLIAATDEGGEGGEGIQFLSLCGRRQSETAQSHSVLRISSLSQRPHGTSAWTPICGDCLLLRRAPRGRGNLVRGLFASKLGSHTLLLVQTHKRYAAERGRTIMCPKVKGRQRWPKFSHCEPVLT